MASLTVTHYSDVLCIWAYIAQVRVRELERNFTDELRFDYRYFHVFGDVHAKLARQWAGRGDAAGYAAHVATVTGQFDHVRLHGDTWTSVIPRSSMPAHLWLCAARLAAPAGDDGEGLRRFDLAVREAFFADARDIGARDVLAEVAAQAGFAPAALDALIASGAAHAALASDMAAAAELQVRASPTLVFNEGRQILTGNVGYRVLEANVRELLRHPVGQQSWC